MQAVLLRRSIGRRSSLPGDRVVAVLFGPTGAKVLTASICEDCRGTKHERCDKHVWLVSGVGTQQVTVKQNPSLYARNTAVTIMAVHVRGHNLLCFVLIVVSCQLASSPVFGGYCVQESISPRQPHKHKHGGHTPWRCCVCHAQCHL